ncbi:MAG: GNAT family N-acetyltransferase [Bacteroidota bacterium]
MIDIRTLQPQEVAKAQAFYKTQNYLTSIQANDIVLVAEKGDRFVGIVRLCPEENFLVLRGMFVDLPYYQRKGIGKQMLQSLASLFGAQEVYCLPYDHLQDFYGVIGFKKINAADAPTVMRDRLQKYSKRFDGLILMKRTAVG